MTPDRKVLRKRSKVGSSESIPGQEMYQTADGGKEMSAKEKAKRDKLEKEREKAEAKERDLAICLFLKLLLCAKKLRTLIHHLRTT